MKRISLLGAMLGVALPLAPAAAQTFSTNDPVLRAIWNEGMNNSQLYPLAQSLLDSVGPRLTGSQELRSASDWALARYRSWGIPARREQWGTWTDWRSGTVHVDLTAPRVRTLEAYLAPWSPGTQGAVDGDVVTLPTVSSAAEFEAWLPQARGKWVMIAFPQPTCRPDDNWEKWAMPGSFDRMKAERQAALLAWNSSMTATGVTARDMPKRLEQAGALGVVTGNWNRGWGVDFNYARARTERVPTVDLACEDYGLVYRLAQNRQGPKLRVDATAQVGAEAPVFNTVAEVRGSRKPNEYVMMSAHFDSWTTGSGATDNGTGTVTMMEAMRILRKVYPKPRRTLLVGHWAGEEQGLNGSRAFVADHPEVVAGLQALFNQDNGTGRVTNIGMQGFTGAAGYFDRWLRQIPTEITQYIKVDSPGSPSTGGSDHSSFVCAKAPAFMLGSLSWDYGTYTWHTNRDTFDKISWDDLRNNAVLVAMLVYLASEDPDRVPRDVRTDLTDNQGHTGVWPACQPPTRAAAQSTR
ncbi:MAG: M20/M25/M40 family metallo-hydrolase [Gemmatimonadetes bacterium]|nr:M20/M25/M40 family metallo-hydrolase [Gemmatimonadota bacterium]